jgi:hypothetical protein
MFLIAKVQLRFLKGPHVARRFSFLCCLIMCLYVGVMLRCMLRFPRKHDVQFVFTSSCW